MPIERRILNDHRPNRFTAVAIAAVFALAAFVAGRMSVPEGSSDSRPDPGFTVPPGATGLRSAAPSPARTRVGAVAAATHSARVMSTASSDRAGFIDATAGIAAPSWKDNARRLADNTVDFVVDRYGPEGSTTFVPVRYRLVTFYGGSAVVEVWGVTLGHGDIARGVEASWVTGTIELAWIAGEWRVTGGDSRVGPTPELLQNEEPLAGSSLAGFKEYAGVPRP